jgi:hypothetical protein
MKNVAVELKSSNSDAKVKGRYILESRASPGSDWRSTDVIDVESGTPEAKRDFLLDDNERIVIEGADVIIPVYVKEQNAAMTLGGALGHAGMEMPVVTSLSPNTAAIGGADVEMTVAGTGFSEESVIVFNGGDEVTAYESATALKTTVKPSLATVEGPVPVAVRNGPALSEQLEFTFTAAAGVLGAKAFGKGGEEEKIGKKDEDRSRESIDGMRDSKDVKGEEKPKVGAPNAKR